jgi:MFS family permease
VASEVISPIGEKVQSARRAAAPGAYYALTLLFLTYLVSVADRMLLPILVEPVKHDLQASDTMMGFLTGLAFAVFYSFAGIPIARWADRSNRFSIISAGLAIWSLMTAVSGVVTNFVQMALARIGVGVGESTCTPVAQSLISDYFPPERRALAMSVYHVGSALGVAVGLMLAGWISDHYGWRSAFLVLGPPGLLLAALLKFSIKEPRRNPWEVRNSVGVPPLRETFALLWVNRAYVYGITGAALMVMTLAAVFAWLPATLMRVHQLSAQDVGLWMGPLQAITGVLGGMSGGVLAHRLARSDVRWEAWVPALACLLAAPCVMAVAIAPNAVSTLAIVAPVMFMGSMYGGPCYALIQRVIDPRSRALAAAILLFFMNLIGYGLGPQFVGIVSDLLQPDLGQRALPTALASAGVFAILAAVCFWLSSRRIEGAALKFMGDHHGGSR